MIEVTAESSEARKLPDSMTGKVVVLTGATSGIGQATAERLAQMGARIVQIARDRARGAAALHRLRTLSPNDHRVHYANLELVSETKRVAAAIVLTETRLDVLINNAGAIFTSRQITSEGLERTFALNHMAYFVLTRCLLERLSASPQGRVINTASDAYQAFALDIEDLQSAGAYRQASITEWLRFGGPAYKVYARSKLCNVLFTRALARKVRGTPLTVNCVHPGFVATRFASGASGLISFSMGIAKRFASPPDVAGQRLADLASNPRWAQTTGAYFVGGRPVPLGRIALDETLAETLWQASSSLAGG